MGYIYLVVLSLYFAAFVHVLLSSLPFITGSLDFSHSSWKICICICIYANFTLPLTIYIYGRGRQCCWRLNWLSLHWGVDWHTSFIAYHHCCSEFTATASCWWHMAGRIQYYLIPYVHSSSTLVATELSTESHIVHTSYMIWILRYISIQWRAVLILKNDIFFSPWSSNTNFKESESLPDYIILRLWQ